MRILLVGLSLLAAGWSGLGAYTHWLAATKTDAGRLEAALHWQRRLGFSWAQSAVSLAALLPQREKELLGQAAEDPRAGARVLVRLAILEEMEGRREASRQWMQRALERGKTYQTYLAAAGQAARWGEEENVLRWAKEALRYCPGEADAVFHLLAQQVRGEDVLRQAETRRRVDYLRYLIGQEKYLPALEYQSSLEDSETVAGLRRELAERLILNQHWEEALRLHPDPKRGGVQNARFEVEPTSLAYDWRLAKHEAVRMEWSPGKLQIRLTELQRPQELLSQYVKHSGEELPRVAARWEGNVGNLEWRQERVHRDWVRVALVAPAGGQREVALVEVQVAQRGS